MPRDKIHLPFNVIFFYLLMLLPVWMWLAWVLWPKTELKIIIVDKTVLSSEGHEHASLNWILRNKKYSKSNNQLYNL